jgi:hypothetical protein
LLLVGAFYKKHVHLPSPETPIEIKDNPKLYPYFRDCIGAIDGSHFHAWVLNDAMGRYRNRKGFIGQNVLAACNFAMLLRASMILLFPQANIILQMLGFLSVTLS